MPPHTHHDKNSVTHYNCLYMFLSQIPEYHQCLVLFLFLRLKTSVLLADILCRHTDHRPAPGPRDLASLGNSPPTSVHPLTLAGAFPRGHRVPVCFPHFRRPFSAVSASNGGGKRAGSWLFRAISTRTAGHSAVVHAPQWHPAPATVVPICSPLHAGAGSTETPVKGKHSETLALEEHVQGA